MNSFPRKSWAYWLTPGAIECAYWAGDTAPALAAHFHDEDQWTFVLSGSRSFRVGSTLLRAEAGECILIPAGLPHRSLALPHERTRCLNIYLPPSNDWGGAVVLNVPHPSADAEPETLLSIIEAMHQSHGRGEAKPKALPPPDLARSSPIGEIAAHHRLSREAFTRRFIRMVGLPPHAFRIASRLNEGRRRLRAGDRIAATAAELGFADQSHFGRHFRRAFGVSPGAYAKHMR